jgi:hypothetical protein
MGFRQPGRRNRWLFWPAELLRAVGVAFLFPLVILAIVIPLGLALNGLIIGGGWLWNALW